jgi:hypothetical protein
MSKVLDTFVEWFNELRPSQKAEIVRYINNQQKIANFDGYYAGPAPTQKYNSCPHCGKPL